MELCVIILNHAFETFLCDQGISRRATNAWWIVWTWDVGLTFFTHKLITRQARSAFKWIVDTASYTWNETHLWTYLLLWDVHSSFVTDQTVRSIGAHVTKIRAFLTIFFTLNIGKIKSSRALYAFTDLWYITRRTVQWTLFTDAILLDIITRLAI